MKIKLAAMALLLTACQTYNFEPVQPLAIAQTTQDTTVIAKTLAPNIMIVVDKSGSMTKPTDPTVAACQTGNPSCPVCGLAGCGGCPANCPTRISDLQSAMSSFLGGAGMTLANYGLTVLPKLNAGACDAAAQGDILVPINMGMWSSSDNTTTMASVSAQIATTISGITPVGGTPTAPTLGLLASDPANNGQPYQPLVDPARISFVLLLTDGEPNCNQSNPNDCGSAACQCTFYQGTAPAPGSCPGPSCACGAPPNGGMPGPSCLIGCIDTDAVSASIDALRGLKVRTIPIGFGLETLAGAGIGTGYAPGALNAMATHGGFARSCPMMTDAECNDPGVVMGNPLYDTCDVASGLQCGDGTTYCCKRRYYVALDAAALSTALINITKQLVNQSPCVYQLQATPQNSQLLVVLINGTDVPPVDKNGNTNWSYSPPSANQQLPTVTFQGQVCTQLTNATPQNPVQLEFRIVQSL